MSPNNFRYLLDGNIIMERIDERENCRWVYAVRIGEINKIFWKSQCEINLV